MNAPDTAENESIPWAQLSSLRKEMEKDKKMSHLLHERVGGYPGALVGAARLAVDTGRTEIAVKLGEICEGIGEKFWARLIRENILGQEASKE